MRQVCYGCATVWFQQYHYLVLKKDTGDPKQMPLKVVIVPCHSITEDQEFGQTIIYG